MGTAIGLGLAGVAAAGVVGYAAYSHHQCMYFLSSFCFCFSLSSAFPSAPAFLLTNVIAQQQQQMAMNSGMGSAPPFQGGMGGPGGTSFLILFLFYSSYFFCFFHCQSSSCVDCR